MPIFIGFLDGPSMGLINKILRGSLV